MSEKFRMNPAHVVRVNACVFDALHLKASALQPRKLGFYFRSGHNKDARRSAQAEVRRVLCMCCTCCKSSINNSSCLSLNSVQSFVSDNCNGPPIENGLNNVCLHQLSHAFTFLTLFLSVS